MAPNIQLSFGPMLIGTFVNMILYGILIMQTFHYYLTYKNDPRWIKALVYYLFIVESLNTACDMQMMYQPLIQHFGEEEATRYFPMMFAAEPIVIVAVSTPIQFFFAWRVRLLTKSNWLAGLICFFSVVSLGTCLPSSFAPAHSLLSMPSLDPSLSSTAHYLPSLLWTFAPSLFPSLPGSRHYLRSPRSASTTVPNPKRTLPTSSHHVLQAGASGPQS